MSQLEGSANQYLPVNINVNVNVAQSQTFNMEKLIMASNNQGQSNQKHHAPHPQPGGVSPRMNKGGKTNRNNPAQSMNMMNQGAAKSTRYGKFQL